jgi:MFS family permease
MNRHTVAWRNAVFVIFGLAGIGLSSWVSRVPAVRDYLHASSSEMGLLLLGLSAGSILGFILSSRVVTTLGAKDSIFVCLCVAAGGLTIVGVSSAVLGSYPLVFFGLAVFGVGTCICNVAINVEAAAIERAVGRAIMPMFHAVYSIGAVVGVGLGALASAVHLSVAIHLGIVTALIVGSAAIAMRHFPAPEVVRHGPVERTATVSDAARTPAVWHERRTIMIGLLVLGMSFASGAANDWIALAMVDGHDVSNTAGALVYGAFIAATTLGRIGGVRLLDRYGRVRVIRGSVVLAMVGLALFIFVPSPVFAVVGAVLWGLGTALSFPIGMSAAADDPLRAPARISAVAAVGYGAALIGPPSIGLLGEHLGSLHALILVFAFIAMSALVSSSARKPAVANR